MPTAAHTTNARGRPGAVPRSPGGRHHTTLGRHLQPPLGFAQISLRYLLHVLPAARVELARWGTLTEAIPSSSLRASAEEALGKRGNIEGAALFATLAAPAHRGAAIRAIVAFQTAYNYLDTLSEQRHPDPGANAEQLHQALLCALAPDAPHEDYYGVLGEHADGGYLIEMLDACRQALAELPSFSAVAPTAREAAGRIIDFQTLNLDERHGGHASMTSWARESTPQHSGLHWWETAAACGSSLSVYALIAAAARSDTERFDARGIDRIYFPWAGALHSLLDSLVDRREDQGRGRVCLLDNYGSSRYAAVRLAILTERALRAGEELEQPQHHRAIVTAMCSYYLSADECATAEAYTIRRMLTRTLGPALSVAILLFRARRIASTIIGHHYS